MPPTAALQPSTSRREPSDLLQSPSPPSLEMLLILSEPNEVQATTTRGAADRQSHSARVQPLRAALSPRLRPCPLPRSLSLPHLTTAELTSSLVLGQRVLLNGTVTPRLQIIRCRPAAESAVSSCDEKRIEEHPPRWPAGERFKGGGRAVILNLKASAASECAPVYERVSEWKKREGDPCSTRRSSPSSRSAQQL